MASTGSNEPLVVCAGTERVVADRQRFCQYETAPSMGGGASETFREVLRQITSRFEKGLSWLFAS